MYTAIRSRSRYWCCGARCTVVGIISIRTQSDDMHLVALITLHDTLLSLLTSFAFVVVLPLPCSAIRRQQELKTVCKHFLNKASPDTVSVTTVDRLGLDLRVKARDLTDEFRIGFRQPVSNPIALSQACHTQRLVCLIGNECRFCLGAAFHLFRNARNTTRKAIR